MLNSLVKKIFFSIFAMFVFVILIQLLFQNYLLEDIYEIMKVAKVEESFHEFVDELKVKKCTKEEIEHQIDLYDDTASILVFNTHHEIINDDFFQAFNYITIADINGVEYKIIIDFLVDERGVFRNPNNEINYNEKIKVKGLPVKGTAFIEPLELHKQEAHFINDDGYFLWHQLYENDVEHILEIEGEVVNRNFILRDNGVRSYQQEKLYEEVKNFWIETKGTSKIAQNTLYEDNYVYTEEYSGLKIMVLIEEVADIEGETFYVFSLFTFENIHDAFQVLNGYYYYIFLFQLLLIAVLVFFYSKWITHPLLSLIDSAKSISELDFTKRTEIDSNDELSVLSESLNSISNNLSSAIAKLETSNNQLGIEVIKRKENEVRMRNLLSSLSHEFKTPLGIMSGFLEVIRDNVGDKEPEYYMNVISEEIDKLNELVLETIELSKLETGTYKLNFVDFEFQPFVESVVCKFDKPLKDKKMILEMNCEDSVVTGDIKKIDQVMTNIISNGIRYSSEYEKIIITSMSKENKLYISVVNTGAIIHEENLDKIWDRFYRAEKSRNRNLGGSGLGLTIVKNILERHESEYAIKNVDNGVEFIFSLKLK